jgi:hypothetical protein
MTLMFDARVPVVFGASLDAREGDAVLADGLEGAPGHDAGCACCMTRTPAAQALSRLFMRRARGEVAFFRRVLVDGHAAEVSVRAALRSDPVVAARFRLA